MTDYAKEEQHIKEYDKFVFGGLKCDCEPEKDLLKCPECLRKRKKAALDEANKDYAATVKRQTEIFKLLWANNIVFLGAFGYLLLNRNEVAPFLAFFVALGAFVHTAIIEGVFQSSLDLSKNWISHMYHLENSICGRLNKTETFTGYKPTRVNVLNHRIRGGSALTVEKIFLVIYGIGMLYTIVDYFRSYGVFRVIVDYLRSYEVILTFGLMVFCIVGVFLWYILPSLRRKEKPDIRYIPNWYDTQNEKN